MEGVELRATPDHDAMFRLLVENVRDYAIFMLDPDGYITTWNGGAQNIKGYAKDEILGKHFSIFYPPDAIARRLPQYELEVARARGRFEDEGWRLRKDGTAFWANVVISAVLDDEQRLRGFAKVTRDLTARREVEQLQQTERRMNEFLAMLAHELRNPLSPIQAALDVVERRPDDRSTWLWAREIIERQIRQLKRLVDDLLDVSRITRGDIALHPETVDLRAIAGQVVESWRPTFEARQQVLELTGPDTPLFVRVDPERLAQTLSNLVGNAGKYTQDGGRIQVSARGNAAIASITIADNGIGMAPELVPRIFDLFVQGDRALDRREGGLGVGLTLAKQLVDRMGGTLSAASAGRGQGSEFTMGFPTVVVDAPQVSGPETTSSGCAGQRSIVVVDDNQDAANALGALLEVLGHSTRVVYDGTDALRAVAAERPDVVLLDIGLPGLDGFEVARRLRGLPGLGGVRLIACTGYGRDQDARRIAEAGFDAHLVKPVSAADLARALGG